MQQRSTLGSYQGYSQPVANGYVGDVPENVEKGRAALLALSR